MEPFEHRNHRLENAGGSVGGWPGEGLIAPCLAVWLCLPALQRGRRGGYAALAGLPGGSQQRGTLEAKARAGKLRRRRVPVPSLPCWGRNARDGARLSPRRRRPAPARGAWPGRGPGERRHGALAVIFQRQSCLQHAPAPREAPLRALFFLLPSLS